MTFGPLMAISPRSPSATVLPGSLASRNVIVMPGPGIPQEPGLRCTPSPIGVNVPEGDVSVMPQPSEMSQPVSRLNSWMVSTGSGAPPDAQYFSDVISSLSIPGKPIIPIYMVGTPRKTLIFFAGISARNLVQLEPRMQHELRTDPDSEQHVRGH